MINISPSPVTVFLKTLDGFRDLDAEEINDIAKTCAVKQYAEGQYLMRRGEVGHVMYLLMEGQVRVLVPDENGKPQRTLLLGSGDVVGEMALLTDEQRRADVIASTPVSVLAMERQYTDHLLRQYPPWANFLTSVLVKRIRSVDGFRKIGKYQLLDELGEGSTAKVYGGMHEHLGRPVAIKMLNHALVYNGLFQERFQTEARIIARLQHPNIIQVYDTEHAHGTFFIIMERLQGKDLKIILKQVSRFSPGEAVLILRQVASALEYAHQQGILHRDIKPANCIMTEDGHVKLMDFGLSRPLNASETTSVEGSPDYLAPEVIRGKVPDERSDVYALGIMAFTLLTGQPPFHAKNVREVLLNHIHKAVPDIASFVPEIPSGLLEFIQGSLVKNPDRRLTDWPTILSMLEHGETSHRTPYITQTGDRRSVFLSCPAGSMTELTHFLQELSKKIEGLTWSVPHHSDASPTTKLPLSSHE